MLVGAEGVCIVAQIGLDAANTEVHLCELPSGRVALLAKDGDVLYHVAAMVLDEGGGLHEHASAAAAGDVHTTVERLEDFNQYRTRRRFCPPLMRISAGSIRMRALTGLSRSRYRSFVRL